MIARMDFANLIFLRRRYSAQAKAQTLTFKTKSLPVQIRNREVNEVPPSINIKRHLEVWKKDRMFRGNKYDSSNIGEAFNFGMVWK